MELKLNLDHFQKKIEKAKTKSNRKLSFPRGRGQDAESFKHDKAELNDLIAKEEVYWENLFQGVGESD